LRDLTDADAAQRAVEDELASSVAGLARSQSLQGLLPYCEDVVAAG
jgi:hypothetical protein